MKKVYFIKGFMESSKTQIWRSPTAALSIQDTIEVMKSIKNKTKTGQTVSLNKKESNQLISNSTPYSNHKPSLFAGQR